MKAIVVYESLWGNTAAIGKAIAEGIGPDARALSTAEATAEDAASADLIVAGAPVLGFSLPTEQMRKGLPNSTDDAPTPPNLSAPSMRSWLAELKQGNGKIAAFETRIWWSPGGATGTIEKELVKLGYTRVAKAGKFIVTGRYGPLKEGELERAREWGKELVQAAR